MAIKPRRRGIERVSEGDQIRQIGQERQNTNKNGKFCVGCKKYFGYLKPTQSFCARCEQQVKSLRK